MKNYYFILLFYMEYAPGFGFDFNINDAHKLINDKNVLAMGLCKLVNVIERDVENCVYDNYPCDGERFNLANNRCCKMKIDSIDVINDYDTKYNGQMDKCLRDIYGYKNET